MEKDYILLETLWIQQDKWKTKNQDGKTTWQTSWTQVTTDKENCKREGEFYIQQYVLSIM